MQPAMTGTPGVMTQPPSVTDSGETLRRAVDRELSAHPTSRRERLPVGSVPLNPSRHVGMVAE
jgi:hypothetical protein